MKSLQTPESPVRDFEPPRGNASLPPENRDRQPVKLLKFAVIAILFAAVAWTVKYYVLPRFFPAPEENVVRASGRIEGREVSVGPKDIQGRVKRLLVDEGASVEEGQLLAELDSKQLDARTAAVEANISNFTEQIQQASIDLAYTRKSADASIAAAEAAVGSAESHLARAKAVLAASTMDYDRANELFDKGLIPKSSLDQATMAIQTSQADVDASEKDLAHAKAGMDVALASKDAVAMKAQQIRVLEQSRRAAQAQLAEAKANSAERQITAPIRGTILSRPVEVGDIVGAGSPVFVMVDLNRLYLKVYVPETQIAKLKLGAEAAVTVDAFPGRTFPAKISKVYEQAEFTPKNVETPEERVKLVFGVELSLLNNEGILKPGMPADCAIRWDSIEPGQTPHEP